MAFPPLRLSRRGVLAGLAALAAPRLARGAEPALSLEAAWSAVGSPAAADRPAIRVPVLSAGGDWNLTRGASAPVRLRNALDAPMSFLWRGLPAAALEPSLALPPLAPGEQQDVTLPLPYAGTFSCIAALTGPVGGSACFGFAVRDGDAALFDRDEILIFEALPDGGWIGNRARDPVTIALRPRQQLRLRIINGSQASPFALKFDSAEPIRVIAIDGHPAEPFQARDGRLAFAPGTRIDVALDAPATETAIPVILSDLSGSRAVGRIAVAGAAVRPEPKPLRALPTNGLPAQIRLQEAQRLTLDLSAEAGWRGLDAAAADAPAFRAKRGAAVVLSLTNPPGSPAASFHLHGHPFRLLDRLDDGWKPFWLDTLMIGSGQTERIAFVAEQAGRWLIEMTVIAPPAGPRYRGYAVS